MDLTKLSPAEKDQLLTQLIAKHEGGEASSAPDPEFSRYEKLCDVIELMCSEIEAVQDQVSAIRKLVVDDFLGGLEGMYKTNVRKQGIGALKDKYGELFGPMESVLKSTDPDHDVYESLFDQQESMRGGEGYSDEAFDGKVKEWAMAIQAKIDELRKSGEIPEDAEVKVEVETPVDESKTARFMRELGEKNAKRGKAVPVTL